MEGDDKVAVIPAGTLMSAESTDTPKQFVAVARTSNVDGCISSSCRVPGDTVMSKPGVVPKHARSGRKAFNRRPVIVLPSSDAMGSALSSNTAFSAGVDKEHADN